MFDDIRRPISRTTSERTRAISKLILFLFCTLSKERRLRVETERTIMLVAGGADEKEEEEEEEEEEDDDDEEDVLSGPPGTF